MSQLICTLEPDGEDGEKKKKKGKTASNAIHLADAVLKFFHSFVRVLVGSYIFPSDIFSSAAACFMFYLSG